MDSDPTIEEIVLTEKEIQEMDEAYNRMIEERNRIKERQARGEHAPDRKS